MKLPAMRPSRGFVDASNRGDMMTMINAFDASAVEHIPARDRALIERRERLLGPAYRLFYANPVHIVRGEGAWLYDPDGNGYLDVYNNVCLLYTSDAADEEDSVVLGG